VQTPKLLCGLEVNPDKSGNTKNHHLQWLHPPWRQVLYHIHHPTEKRWKSATSLPPSMQQMMLIGTKHDPHATEWMDIAIADFIFSNGLPIILVECAKFNKLIQSARHIPQKYTPPYREKMAGTLLDDIHQSTYDKQMRSLLKESKLFGIALFGNGAIILKVPMMIFLGSSPNNPFALLDIVDCTSEMAKGGKKDAK
jgi:hypothetical protein